MEGSAKIKQLVAELAAVNDSIRNASKQTSDARKRRNALKREVLDLMEKMELDEIADDDVGIVVKRSVNERPAPLGQDHVVKAVGEILGAAEADGQRVAAAADRARETIMRASISLKRVKKSGANVAAEDD